MFGVAHKPIRTTHPKAMTRGNDRFFGAVGITALAHHPLVATVVSAFECVDHIHAGCVAAALELRGQKRVDDIQCEAFTNYARTDG